MRRLFIVMLILTASGLLRADADEARSVPAADVVPFTLPALVGSDHCGIMQLKITAVGKNDSVSLTGIGLTFEGTSSLSEISSLRFFNTGSSGEFPVSDSFAEIRIDTDPIDASVNKNQLQFSFPSDACPLTEGDNTIWVTCRLRNDADIDHTIVAACRMLTFSNGKTASLDAPPSIQRMGVALRKAGDDGVHTYRIPGLDTTNEKTLIAVYDVRRRSGGDLPADIDVGMSRSTDGGRSWEPMKIIMDMGDDPQWHYDGIGDPAVLVDRNTGTIWVAALWSHGNRGWRGSGPGLTPEETAQLMLVRSDDDGITWSEPINITEQIKQPGWCLLLQGPGKGITMRDGTLVFAAQFQDTPENNRVPRSTIIYSKDHGRTWHIGTAAHDDTTEAQVVETEPGVLMLNCRYDNADHRIVMTTSDLGQTWERHPTSDGTLNEPGSCMASLIDVQRELSRDRSDWLLFSNPDSTEERDHITIKASPDRGLTWPKDHRLLLDEGECAGYSCLTVIDSETIGILYEGSRAHLTFQRIPLRELTGTNGR